jgi:hypothetical protein
MASNGRDHGAGYMLPKIPSLATSGGGGSNRTISINGNDVVTTPGLASQGSRGVSSKDYGRYRNDSGSYTPQPQPQVPVNRSVVVNGGVGSQTPTGSGAYVYPGTDPYRNGMSPQNVGGGLHNYINKPVTFGTSPAQNQGLAASGALNQGRDRRDEEFDQMMAMNKLAMDQQGADNAQTMKMKQQQMDMYAKAFAVDYKNQQTMARQTTA